MIENFVPLKSKLVVKRLQENNVDTNSGIILDTKVQKNTAFGEVISIGDKVSKAKVGNVIMFSNMIMSYIEDGYLLMEEDDIYGIITEGTKLNGVNNFKLVHPNDILVEVATMTNEVTNTSGIILSAAASAITDRPTNGLVVQIGSGVDVISISDRVEFEKTAGIDLTKNPLDKSKHYILMDIERVIGKYL